MPSEKKIEVLFKIWNDLNKKVECSLGTYDFDTIKIVRNEQKQIEDDVYTVVLKNAPVTIKEFLPEDCGEMEIGYETEGNKFYYLMEDPEEPPEGPIKLLAITIDSAGKIETIKDFHAE